MKQFLHIKILFLFGLNILFGFSAYSQLPDFTSTQTVCVGTTSTYTAYGFDGSDMYFDVYESDGTTEVSLGNLMTEGSTTVTSGSETYYKYTLDYQWTISDTYVVKVRELTSNGCEGIGDNSLTVTVVDLPATPTGDSSQSLCIGSTISDLVASSASNNIYWYSSDTGGTALDVTGELSTGTYYAEASNTSSCVSDDRLEVNVTINSNSEISLSSATGTDNQSLCINTTITDITFAITNETGATVSGLPNGLSGVYSNGTYTISGTPSESGVFLYSVIASGVCESDTIKGTITVNSLPDDLSLTADMSVCASDVTTLSVDSTNYTDYSMSFDGSNDYLSIGNSSDINSSTHTERTVMLWFKPSDIINRQVIYEEGGGTHGLSIYIESGAINAYGWVSGSSWEVASGELSATDKWYHFTYTWNGSTLDFKAYLNGNLVETVTGESSMPSHTGDIRIGNAGSIRLPDNSTGSGDPFSGNIDNFRLWNSELSQTEIVSEMSAENALVSGDVLDYDFDDYDSATSAENSGSAGDATVNGAVYESDNSILWDDASNSTTFSIDVNPGTTTTYTATVSSENGCSTSADVTLTVNDLPLASAGGSSTICPTGSVMVTGASSENGTISWTHDGAGSLSDATTINPTYTASSSDLGNTVTLTLTVTGEDSCNGESATAEYTIYVADDTAPVADVASLLTITAQCEVTSLTAPTATDACAGTITGTHDATLPISGEGSTTVTWTYDDGNGNTSTQTQTVTIDDTTAPVTPTLTDVTVGECSGTPTAPTTTDACAGTITGTTSTVFPITTQGTTIVTWTFADGNGNSTTADQNVIVDDTTDPTITAPADVTANSDSGSCDAAASGITLGTPTTDDNCGVASVTNDAPSTFPLGATTVTWTVTDNAGLTATATQTVTVSDSENPTITAPADVTANSDSGSCDAAASGITLGTPTTDDNCGVASVTNDAPSTFPLGATTVTWTVTDNAGLTATDTQIVTVDDTTAPVLADLSDLDIEDCSDDEATQTKIITGLDLDASRYSDNCSSTFVVQYRIQLPDSSYANEYGSSATGANSSSDPSGYEFTEGTSTIYFRVLDEEGNISNVQSYLILIDPKPNPSEIDF